MNDIATPPSAPLAKSFEPAAIEARWSPVWEARGYFKAGLDPSKQAFSIQLPPPNVTGLLHMGHGFNHTIMDALTRYHRMAGFNTLWLPGTDHAGIATQIVVERQLEANGVDRRAMGREAFIKQVWDWKEYSGGTILNQMRRLGDSVDWSRTYFTMDDKLSQVVIETFVQLFEQGLIYRGKRLVNWDPVLKTAVSDLEVASEEENGTLWHIRYPFAEGAGHVTVATTRPETMLGDVAVAVHPDDERYKDLVGRHARLPLANRPIPIIADEYSDPEKGTGAVKITPGHDFNDFEVGKRNKLPLINILSKDGSLGSDTSPPFKHVPVEGTTGLTTIDPAIIPEQYRGLDRFEARKRVVADLEAEGLIEKTEDIVHAVPHDEKTKTVVLEPYLTEQWYLNVTPLAEKAIEAVEKGRTRIVPDQWENVYFNWMRNIQPWCISRQLWWGHQIPAWYGPDGYVFVEETEAEASASAVKHYGTPVTLIRDPDVLDTWFSSALWPFSTLGWPDKTPELARYYPTSVLVTAFDIIFFWVARMMMMGLHFMDDVPFKDVFIHNRVLDERGQKMSKTKGNVVDPLDIIDEYGADALRFALCIAAGQGRDIRLGLQRVETCRNFGTKLWNAARFCEMNGCVRKLDFDPATVEMTVNKWIVGEAARTAAEVNAGLAAYRFNEAAGAIYHFVWDVFCDWYLEFIKPVLNGGDENEKRETRHTAAWVLDRILQLLHPFMPFITEELWARMAEHATPRTSMLMLSPWPNLSGLPAHDDARTEMNWLIDLVANIRSVRAEMNVPPAARITLILKDASEESSARLARHRDLVLTLARLSSALVSPDIPKGSAQFVIGEAVAALPLGDVIDIDKERARLAKEIKKAEDEIARIDAKLSNAAFVAKAPAEIIDEQKEKRAEYAAIASRLSEAVNRLTT
jgi:valyl-tRNA synthetase